MIDKSKFPENSEELLKLIDSLSKRVGVLENQLPVRGTATVASGQTHVHVTHGLPYAPTSDRVMVCPTNSMGAATKFYHGSYTVTEFIITVDADPGATTATFDWWILPR